MSMEISLALTHFNRFELLMDCIAPIMNDPRIGEIVISDDKSTDGSWEKLCGAFRDHPKVRLFQNLSNLDCYRNKATALKRCTRDWAILFDSDNILTPDYLDVLYQRAPWCSKIVYCPDFAMPSFDYTEFSGAVVDRLNVARFMQKKDFATCLNTANYFVCPEEYLKVWNPEAEPHTADSIYQMLNWFSANNGAFIVPGLRYFHRVHDQSHYKLNVHKTGNFAKVVESRLKALR